MSKFVLHQFVKNMYRDSVSLMRFADTLTELQGVEYAAAVMATENNINMLLDMSLLDSSLKPQPNDLLLVVHGADQSHLEDALTFAKNELSKDSGAASSSGQVKQVLARTINMGLTELPEANLVLISTPGEYAAAEALKALKQGLNVMIFSDNVSIADEIMLKQYAHDHGLLCMGPDCGTVIINGVPLGFANVVKQGSIGLIGASGTGVQQVSCLIDRFGGGISQAVGVGSRDLSEKVGGISMLMALDALAADTNTETIVLISKPPSEAIAEKVVEKASESGKPVIANFIGADLSDWSQVGVAVVRTLEDAAYAAVGQQSVPPKSVSLPISTERKYLRGLFSGGTLCYEALLILEDSLGPINSNIPLNKSNKLEDVWHSKGHTAIDLGDDAFTIGRPHPMIDMRLRNERILQEAADPETAVVLLDVVLGYGAHPDPAGELAPVIEKAREASQGRVVFIASVCGTEGDPQVLSKQERQLKDVGVYLAESNAQAARMAGHILKAIEEK